jgi:hypothetical protein
VKIGDIPSFSHDSIKSGEFAGCVSVNEMVLCKIPNDLYQDVMAHFFHDAPNELEEGVVQRAKYGASDPKNRTRIRYEGDEDGLFSDSSSKTPIFEG